MWRELTDHGRRTLLRAQSLVEETSYPTLTTLHLLVAIISVEECTGHRLLARMLPNLPQDTLQHSEHEEQETYIPGKMTPTAETCLKDALEMARSAGEEHVGTGFWLLSFVRHPESSAGAYLLDLGLEPGALSQELANEINGGTKVVEPPHGEFSANFSQLLNLLAHPDEQLKHVFEQHGMTVASAIAAYRAGAPEPEALPS